MEDSSYPIEPGKSRDQIGAGVGVSGVNLIQYGKLLIQARLGELLPPKTRQEAGALKGKKGVGCQPIPFHPDTLTTYRTVARHKPELEPWRWGRAFLKLLEIKGIERKPGAHCKDGNAETVSALALDLGVDDRTARRRMNAADAFDDPPQKSSAPPALD